MSLGFYLLVLVFAVFLGYAIRSEGFFYSSNAGHVALIIMGMSLVGLAGWAVVADTWLSGLIALVVIVVGVFLGRIFAESFANG